MLENVGERAQIRFDPGMLPAVDDSIRIEMSDPTAERMAHLSAEMRNLKQRAGRYNALHMNRTGEGSDEPRSYDWTPHRETFQNRIAQADDSPFRNYLLLHVFNNMHVPEADSLLTPQLLEDVEPTAPVWSYLGWYNYSLSNVLHYLGRTSGRSDDVREYIQEMLEDHPDPDVRVQALYRAIGNARYRSEHQRFDRLYQQMMDEFGDRRLAEQVRKRYSPDRAIQVGEQVPDFSAASVEDSTEVFTDDGLRGSVFLVDFWYPGGGSHLKVEHLRAAYDRYSDDGLEIVTVFIEDDREEVQEYLRDLPPMPWPVVMNGTGDTSMAERFEVTGVPHYTLIDERGQIIVTDSDLGYTEFDSTLAAVFTD